MSSSVNTTNNNSFINQINGYEQYILSNSELSTLEAIRKLIKDDHKKIKDANADFQTQKNLLELEQLNLENLEKPEDVAKKIKELTFRLNLLKRELTQNEEKLKKSKENKDRDFDIISSLETSNLNLNDLVDAIQKKQTAINVLATIIQPFRKQKDIRQNGYGKGALAGAFASIISASSGFGFGYIAVNAAPAALALGGTAATGGIAAGCALFGIATSYATAKLTKNWRILKNIQETTIDPTLTSSFVKSQTLTKEQNSFLRKIITQFKALDPNSSNLKAKCELILQKSENKISDYQKILEEADSKIKDLIKEEKDIKNRLNQTIVLDSISNIMVNTAKKISEFPIPEIDKDKEKEKDD